MKIIERVIPIITLIVTYGVGLSSYKEVGISKDDIGIEAREVVKEDREEVGSEKERGVLPINEVGRLKSSIERGTKEEGEVVDKEIDVNVPEILIPTIEVEIDADIKYKKEVVELEGSSIGEIGVEGFKTAYLGEFEVSGYCSCRVCSVGKKSTKVRAYEGVTVSVNANRIPYGTMLMIDGVGLRQTQPTGVSVGENEIKIYMKNHKEVEKFGKKKLRVAKVI